VVLCRELGLPVAEELSLEECISNIPEMLCGFWTNKAVRAVPVDFRAFLSGEERILRIIFRPGMVSEAEFERTWQSDFPSLAACCSFERPGVLRVNFDRRNVPSRELAQCSRYFCSEYLVPSLHWGANEPWFVLKGIEAPVIYSRLPWYLAGLFALSSFVRYQPELILAEHDTETGWVIGRFLDRAERYFPQEMLSWLWGINIFVEPH